MAARTIIGTVGPPGGGKDTVAKYLAERHHFKHVSTGDLIRQYMREHDIKDKAGAVERRERPVAKMLRDTFGGDYLVREALKQPGNLVISGLRTVAEAQALQSAGGQLVAVTADQRKRFERNSQRHRDGDERSFDDFVTIEAQETASDDPNLQNVGAVIAMADFTIENDGSLEDLYRKADEVAHG